MKRGRKAIITKITVLFFLLIIFLASTPIKYFHSFAGHADNHSICGHNTHNTSACIYTSSVNCHIDFPVVNISFEASYLIDNTNLVSHSDKYLSFFGEVYFPPFSNITEGRGPPTV